MLSSTPKAGEKASFRRTFSIEKETGHRSGCRVSVDNEYSLFVNGVKAAGDKNWETIESAPIHNLLKVGENEILLVAVNGGKQTQRRRGVFRGQTQVRKRRGRTANRHRERLAMEQSRPQWER